LFVEFLHVVFLQRGSSRGGGALDGANGAFSEVFFESFKGWEVRGVGGAFGALVEVIFFEVELGAFGGDLRVVVGVFVVSEDFEGAFGSFCEVFGMSFEVFEIFEGSFRVGELRGVGVFVGIFEVFFEVEFGTFGGKWRGTGWVFVVSKGSEWVFGSLYEVFEVSLEGAFGLVGGAVDGGVRSL
jgi:hypothetical protein